MMAVVNTLKLAGKGAINSAFAADVGQGPKTPETNAISLRATGRRPSKLRRAGHTIAR